MSKKRGKHTPFAVAPDGSLFVKLNAVMNPLCAVVDGLPLMIRGRGKLLPERSDHGKKGAVGTGRRVAELQAELPRSTTGRCHRGLLPGREVCHRG